MGWTSLGTLSAGGTVTSTIWNNMVANLTYLKAGRPQLYHDYGTTTWTISAGAGTFEADSDASNFKLEVTLANQGYIMAAAIIRWTSDTAADFAVKYRVKRVTSGGTTTGIDLGYVSQTADDDYNQYVTLDLWEDLSADTYTITLDGARQNAGHTVAAAERTLVAIAGYPGS